MWLLGFNLHCPVFLHDKYEYLRMIPEITLQTLKILITIASDEEKLITLVLKEEFLDNGYHEESGRVSVYEQFS